MTKPRRAQRELPFTTDVPDGVELSSHDIFIWFLSLASLHDSVRAHQLLTSPTCELKRVAVSRCARESSSRTGKTLYSILFLESERESEPVRLWTSYLSRAPPPLAPAASPPPTPSPRNMDLVWIAGFVVSVCAWLVAAERHSVYWNSTNPK